jgi:hypothetical protein
MDFRGPDIEDFVCHILNHEDQGIMAIIRVLPGPGAVSHTLKLRDRPPKATRNNAPVLVSSLPG